MHWDELVSYIKELPYGRISNREDLTLVLSEQKGSCSSKHALLKTVAVENQMEDVGLFIGIYKMTRENTPGIGSVLTDHKLPYMPEAHCYLKIDGEPFDATNAVSDFYQIKKDLIEEMEIEPWQIGSFKVEYHKCFLKNWISCNSVGIPFDQLWSIREKCIENLSNPPL